MITIMVMKGHLMKKVFIKLWPKMGGPVIKPFWPLRSRRPCILSCCWLNLPIRSAFQQHPKPSQSCFMQLLTNLFSVVTRLLCFRIFVWQFENERKTLIWIMFTYHVVSFIWDRPIFKEGWVLCISNTAQVELLAI